MRYICTECKQFIIYSYFYLGKMTIEIMILLSISIVIVFTGVKFVEMQYIDKNVRPLKLYIRDAVYVFISSIGILYVFGTYEKHVLDFFFFITNTKNIATPTQTPIFTGEPGF